MTHLILAVILAATATPAAQQHQHAVPQKGMRTPTVVFASRTKVWRVWTEEGHILGAASADGGKTWAEGTRITREAEPVDANGESRPKITLGTKGEVYVSWTRSGKKSHSGDIRFSRSLDGGKSFDAPRTINDDGVETTHRFDTLAVAADGTIHLAWVDARDADAAKAAKETYVGAALYHAVSRDRGATFGANRKLKDHICECCRIARSLDGDGNLVLLWRDAAGNLRDHVLIRLAANGKSAGKPARATTDDWKINACPHQGPAVAIAGNGVTHMVWFTGEGPLGPGTFYGRLGADGRPVGTPRKLTALSGARGTVEVSGARVVVAWKEARAAGAAILVSESADGGATFSAPRPVAETDGMSDHPLLVRSAGGVYLSWFAAAEGHRLIAL